MRSILSCAIFAAALSVSESAEGKSLRAFDRVKATNLKDAIFAAMRQAIAPILKEEGELKEAVEEGTGGTTTTGGGGGGGGGAISSAIANVSHSVSISALRAQLKFARCIARADPHFMPAPLPALVFPLCRPPTPTSARPRPRAPTAAPTRARGPSTTSYKTQGMRRWELIPITSPASCRTPA